MITYKDWYIRIYKASLGLYQRVTGECVLSRSCSECQYSYLSASRKGTESYHPLHVQTQNVPKGNVGVWGGRGGRGEGGRVFWKGRLFDQSGFSD